MALINLKLIKELYLEAKDSKRQILECCYNWNNTVPELDSNAVATLIITYAQAKNLYRALSELHQICLDFSAGNLKRYHKIYHELYGPHPELPYDPFDELWADFIPTSAISLPPVIEQYRVLGTLVLQFSQIRKMKREGIEGHFKGIPYAFSKTDAEGKTVIITKDSVSPEQWQQYEYKREIWEIEIEYCLDNYDQFYAQCVELIRFHELTGDYQTCAQQILTLYK